MGCMKLERIRVRVRAKRMSSRSHTMPMVRSSEASCRARRPGLSVARAAPPWTSFLLMAPSHSPYSHGHRVLGMILSDLAPSEVQEDIVEGWAVDVDVAHGHAGDLDEPSDLGLTVLGD